MSWIRAVKCVVNVVCPDAGIWPRYTVPTRLPRRSKTETGAVAPPPSTPWGAAAHGGHPDLPPRSVETGLTTPGPGGASGPPARFGSPGEGAPAPHADGSGAAAGWHTTSAPHGHAVPSPIPGAAY